MLQLIIFTLVSFKNKFKTKIMKSINKLCIAVLLLTVMLACKDTKKEAEEAAATKAAIEKVEAVETELEAVTQELDKKAAALDDSLNSLDDI